MYLCFEYWRAEMNFKSAISFSGICQDFSCPYRDFFNEFFYMRQNLRHF